MKLHIKVHIRGKSKIFENLSVLFKRLVVSYNHLSV